MPRTMSSSETVRERVFRRDRYQCQVCGTTHNIEAHHWKLFRSQAGEDTEANLVTMCHAHHMALHNGELSITLHLVGGVWRSFVQWRRSPG